MMSIVIPHDDRAHDVHVDDEKLHFVAGRLIAFEFKNPSILNGNSEGKNKYLLEDLALEALNFVLSLIEINKMDKNFISEKNLATNAYVYVPGLKMPPKYLKLSNLSFKQQFSMLRVIANKHPKVLEEYKFQIAVNRDHKTFRALKGVYEQEQKEFIEWAKRLWTTEDNMKALKTSSVVDEFYESHLKIHFHNLARLQTNYDVAVHIELKHKDHSVCYLTLEEELIPANTLELPELVCPTLNRKFSLFQNKPKMQTLCKKHSSQFLLPDENKATELPINEIYEELARYAARHNITCIMSEGAATRIVDEDRLYSLPVFVRSLVCADGLTRNIVVIGSELIKGKQPARYRNYNVIQHLMHYHFLKNSLAGDNKPATEEEKKPKVQQVSLSSDEESALADNFDDLALDDEPVLPAKRPRLAERAARLPPRPVLNLGEIIACTCQDSAFGKPPIRSYRKWRLSYEGQKIDVIIHSTHKCQMNGQEYILESIPEYQLQLGGTEQSEHKLRSLALAMYLRPNSALLNVRVDSSNGDLITYDHMKLVNISPDGVLVHDAAHMLLSFLNKLTEINVGDYMLLHELGYGSEVVLHLACQHPSEDGLFLSNNCDIAIEAELAELATPPNLGPVFLPFNKYRKILPLAFTYDKKLLLNAVTKPPKKPFDPKNFQFPPSGPPAGPSNVRPTGGPRSRGSRGASRPARGSNASGGPSALGTQTPSPDPNNISRSNTTVAVSTPSTSEAYKKLSGFRSIGVVGSRMVPGTSKAASTFDIPITSHDASSVDSPSTSRIAGGFDAPNILSVASGFHATNILSVASGFHATNTTSSTSVCDVPSIMSCTSRFELPQFGCAIANRFDFPSSSRGASGFKAPSTTRCASGFDSPNYSCGSGFDIPNSTHGASGFDDPNTSRGASGLDGPNNYFCAFDNSNTLRVASDFDMPSSLRGASGLNAPCTTRCASGFDSPNYLSAASEFDIPSSPRGATGFDVPSISGVSSGLEFPSTTDALTDIGNDRFIGGRRFSASSATGSPKYLDVTNALGSKSTSGSTNALESSWDPNPSDVTTSDASGGFDPSLNTSALTSQGVFDSENTLITTSEPNFGTASELSASDVSASDVENQGGPIARSDKPRSKSRRPTTKHTGNCRKR